MSFAGGGLPPCALVPVAVDAIRVPIIRAPGEVSSGAGDATATVDANDGHTGRGSRLPGPQSEVLGQMCFFLSLLLFGPRVVILLWWLIEPLRWSAVFDTFILPLLGFLFLPWTTLMYVLVAPFGITGIDWLWIGLAVAADVLSYAGGAVGGRGRVPGYGA
jgi:hypothetical protein